MRAINEFKYNKGLALIERRGQLSLISYRLQWIMEQTRRRGVSDLSDLSRLSKGKKSGMVRVWYGYHKTAF